jgi:hypothetical protein
MILCAKEVPGLTAIPPAWLEGKSLAGHVHASTKCCQQKCRSSGERLNGACSVHYEEGVSSLYTSAADTHLLPSAEAVACTARSAGG